MAVLTLQSTMRRTGLVLAWGGAWVVGGWGLAGGQEWPYALRIENTICIANMHSKTILLRIVLPIEMPIN